MEKVKISKKAVEEFEYNYWNAFNYHLAMSGLDELSGIIRSAYLAYWLASEVANGGYGQYFDNLDYFDQEEVYLALKEIGAIKQAELLKKAIEIHEEYKRPGLSKKEKRRLAKNSWAIDMEHHNCEPDIFDLLEELLKKREQEIVEWIE